MVLYGFWGAFLKLYDDRLVRAVAECIGQLHFAKKVLVHALPEGRSRRTPPTTVEAVPPRISHRVLSVGAPVNAREMLELTESDALKPYETRMRPTTNKAKPIALFITNLSLEAGNAQRTRRFMCRGASKTGQVWEIAKQDKDTW